MSDRDRSPRINVDIEGSMAAGTDFSPVSSHGFAQSQFFAEAGVEDSVFGDDATEPETQEKSEEKHLPNKRSRVRHYIVKYFIPLQLGVIIALIWANVDYASYSAFVDYDITACLGDATDALGSEAHFTIKWIADDILMVFFFALASVEVVLSVLPGGALYPPSKAICPVLGTIGGILGPAAIYLLWWKIAGADDIVSKGFGITVATDISVSWLAATFAFGSGHPAVKFLLLLAVADDVAGLMIIAIFYSENSNSSAYLWLLLVAGALLVAYGLRRVPVLREYWISFVLIAGVPCWFGLFKSGIHPALALAPVIPFMPAELEPNADPHSQYHGRRGALTRFDSAMTLPVHLILFFFALVNAGVKVDRIGQVTWMVVVSLVVGKTLGIFAFAAFSDIALGFKLPQGMSKRHLFLVGIISGIGLTVALFVASIAFKSDANLLNEAKLGALLSLAAVPMALGISHLIKIEKKWLTHEH